MKKLLAITLVLLFLVSVLVGCTISEIGYYNTFKGMMSLQNFSFSGTISANVDTLTVDAQALGIDIPDGAIESIVAQLNSTQIIYDGTVNKVNNAITFNLKAKTGDVTNNLFNLMLDEDSIALNKDVAEMILPSAPGGTLKTINGVEYIEYDLSDLISYLESTAPSEFLPFIESLTADSPIPSSLTAKINKLFDDFINITCDGLSFENITKIGDNSYQLSLENGDVADVLINTIKYILSNPEKLSDLLLGEDLQSGFIGSLTQDEIDAAFSPIFGSNFTKQDLQAMVAGMLSEIPTGSDLDEATDALDSFLATFKNTIDSMFNYTFTNTLSKLSAEDYKSDSLFTFESVDDSLPIYAKFAVNMTLSVNGIKPITITVKDTAKDSVPDTGC